MANSCAVWEMKLSRKIINSLLQLQTEANEVYEAWLHDKFKRWFNRRYLVHPINQRRLTHGYLATLFRELKTHFDRFMSYDWQLAKCIGAVDGKHINIQSPPHSGSLYFNYKKFYRIVLLAACNHRYEFTIVKVGAYGSESDSGVLARTEFGRSLGRVKAV